jgi:hypothetical protein
MRMSKICEEICEVCDKEVAGDVIHIHIIKQTLLGDIDEWYVMCKNCYNEYKAKR